MKMWTLFLDRDGVINDRIVGGYVRNWGEFDFLQGVLDAMPILARKFNHILVVTNQQGIAKGLMTKEQLEKVHVQLLEEVAKYNVTIDKVYYCSEHHSKNPYCRKPNPGMAEQAKLDFPEIDFDYSIMVGDSISDIEFGKRLNMKTVFIETKSDIDKDKLLAIKDKIDFSYPSLLEFAKDLENIF
jgi:D-glycero-D-manno-heptose 1,7-bisphosphate phosphatase